ncbi:MAG: TadE/TadG family type IV pilus assembly protein, partial [Nitrospiraceae bacterium]
IRCSDEVKRATTMKQHDERGAAAVEFAILLPVLMLILFGIIEFGMVMYSREIITNASREGARTGIVQATAKPTAGQIQTVVTNYLTGTGIDPNQVTINITGVGLAAPNTLTVTVAYPYNFFVPALLGLGNSINLTGQTVMRHE